MKIQKGFDVAPLAPSGRTQRSDPFFERMRDFQEAMWKNMFDVFAPFPYTNSRLWENFIRPETEYLTVPVEVKETEEGFVIHAELPGFKENEIELKVEPERIFIGGKREEEVKEKEGKTIYSERSYRQVGRWFDLPTAIDPDKVKAVLNHGVLEINLLKSHVSKKVRIETKAA